MTGSGRGGGITCCPCSAHARTMAHLRRPIRILWREPLRRQRRRYVDCRCQRRDPDINLDLPLERA